MAEDPQILNRFSQWLLAININRFAKIFYYLLTNGGVMVMSPIKTVVFYNIVLVAW